MKTIPLSNKKGYKCPNYAIIDDEDFEYLNQWKWNIIKSDKGQIFYAVRRKRIDRKKVIMIFMHREILGSTNNPSTDHRNGNGLDNRRSNLRPCSHSQNSCNRGKQKNNTSGYKGVSFYRSRDSWNAQIIYQGKKQNLGYFDNPITAAMAYNEAAIKIHGEFAKINIF